MAAVAFAVDRSLLVRPGERIRTAWVDVERVSLACKARMAVGDVAAAYQRLLQQGDAAAWPPPNGHWLGDEAAGRFVIEDGRHEYVASLMLGRERILVAWVEGEPPKRETRRRR